MTEITNQLLALMIQQHIKNWQMDHTEQIRNVLNQDHANKSLGKSVPQCENKITLSKIMTGFYFIHYDMRHIMLKQIWRDQ
jgi:hypothetical protein